MSDEEKRAKKRAYNARPEVKDRRRELQKRPENKAKEKLNRDRPENKLKVKLYRQQPEVKAKIKAYLNRDDVKSRMKINKQIWYQNNKERLKVVNKINRDKPENKKRKKELAKIKYQENKEEIKIYNQEAYEKNREEIRESQKIYYQENKEVIKKRARVYEEENKEKIKEGSKLYYQNHKNEIIKRVRIYRGQPENKVRRNKNHKQKMKDDVGYRIECSLRSYFKVAMKLYSTKGKKMPSNEYGIDFLAIIEHLKPFPKDIENYHKDHIIPASWFDHNNPEEIKWCWSKDNFQWLRKELNLWKHNKFILPLTIEEQDILMKEMFPNKVKNN